MAANLAAPIDFNIQMIVEWSILHSSDCSHSTNRPNCSKNLIRSIFPGNPPLIESNMADFGWSTRASHWGGYVTQLVFSRELFELRISVLKPKKFKNSWSFQNFFSLQIFRWKTPLKKSSSPASLWQPASYEYQIQIFRTNFLGRKEAQARRKQTQSPNWKQITASSRSPIRTRLFQANWFLCFGQTRARVRRSAGTMTPKLLVWNYRNHRKQLAGFEDVCDILQPDFTAIVLVIKKRPESLRKGLRLIGSP